jgi:flagellin-like hook-associated protein FlgL
MAAEELRGEISRLQTELKRVGQERSLLHQNQSGLKSIRDQLNDLKGLLSGAVGTTTSDEERASLAQQIDATLDAVQQVQDTLAKITPGSGGAAQGIANNVKDLNIGKGTPGEIEQAAATVDSQLDAATFSEASQAAYEKYNLDVREELARNMFETHTAALSDIEDADIAEEASNLITAQTLAAGAQAAIALQGRIGADHVAELINGVAEEQQKLDATLTA